MREFYNLNDAEVWLSAALRPNPTLPSEGEPIMSTLTITQKSSDAGLSEDIRQDADRGSTVVTPHYVVHTREAFERLMDARFDEQLGTVALERSKEPQQGPTLEEVKREYGL